MNTSENTMQIEVFQPEISGQFQQTTLEELKNWIKDGKLKPNHKVRIANLTWVEAKKIPAFQAHFETKEQAHFETKENDSKAQISDFSAQTLHNSFTPEQSKPKVEKTKVSSKSLPVPDTGALVKNKPEAAESAVSFNLKPENDETAVSSKQQALNAKEKPQNAKQETAEPSIPYKIFEEKALAKAKKHESKAFENPKQPDLKTQPVQNIKEPRNKSSFAKKAAGFAAGSILVALFSFVGSYLWVYQLKSPVEVDEKSLIELSNLEDKLTSDKLELRLKESANRQELKNSKTQENPAQQIDVSQAIANLETQFNNQRAIIIENYRNNLISNDFNNTFSFSFAVLMILFLLTRIFYGKNEQSFEKQISSNLPGIQLADDLNIQKTVAQDLHATKPETTHVTSPPEISSAESSGKIETLEEYLQNAENSDSTESPKSFNCLMHRDETAKFYCELCSNYFCAECLKIFEELKDCCPFCKIACKPVEVKTNETSYVPSIAPEEKKKPNLLELGKNTNFVTYDYPDEKTRKIGIVPAFIIALLLSGSISVFWVYKISPYLENRGAEVSQNLPPNLTQKTAGKVDGAINSGQSAVNGEQTAADQANVNAEQEDDICIDPETKREFKCEEEKNEEVRRIFREHAKQVKSVEKAKTEMKEKTNLILSLVSSEARDEVNKSKPKDVKLTAIEEVQKEKDKQMLVKVFACSFLVIFGLLLSTRFFSKGK